MADAIEGQPLRLSPYGEWICQKLFSDPCVAKVNGSHDHMITDHMFKQNCVFVRGASDGTVPVSVSPIPKGAWPKAKLRFTYVYEKYEQQQ